MPRKKTTDYDNTSITTLKGADRVRKRPALIFGSSIEFERISNTEC